MKRLFILMALAALLYACQNSHAKPENELQNKTETTAAADTVAISFVNELPANYVEEDEFYLIMDYGGYEMSVSVWPFGNEQWLLTSYWCPEMESLDMEEEGEETVTAFNDPFDESQGIPVVPSSTLSFMTRNYGGQTIPFYASSEGDEVLCETHDAWLVLRVKEADPKTRRLLVYSHPDDMCWGEPKTEEDAEFIHPFVELRGWIDEEWVCGNTVTTCP